MNSHEQPLPREQVMTPQEIVTKLSHDAENSFNTANALSGNITSKSTRKERMPAFIEEVGQVIEQFEDNLFEFYKAAAHLNLDVRANPLFTDVEGAVKQMDIRSRDMEEIKKRVDMVKQ